MAAHGRSGQAPPVTEELSPAAFARLVDHTALAPTTGPAEIERLCDEARRYGFHAVCVAPCWVETAAQRLAASDVGVCSVVGFPHGNTLTAAKVFEARAVIDQGATEIDVVMALGPFLAGDDRWTGRELEAVVAAAEGRTVKVILETACLDDAQIDRACDLAVAAGATFVKTSTGYGPSGATVNAVRRMRARVGARAFVKASGGIRSAELAVALWEAGADRLGMSASVAVFEELAAGARNRP